MSEITVCIPAYNAASTIKETLYSLFLQGPKVRIIVSDDASTDNTVNVVRKLTYGAPVPITVLEHADNVGVFRNAQRAIEAVKTDYLAQIGADDLFMPGSLAHAAALLDKYEGTSLLFTNGSNMHKHIIALPAITKAAYKAWMAGSKAVLEHLYTRPPGIYANCWIAKKDLIDAVGGYDGTQPCGDWAMNTKMMEYIVKNNLQYLYAPDLVGYVFRRSEHQFSRNHEDMTKRQYEHVERNVPDEFKERAREGVRLKRLSVQANEDTKSERARQAAMASG